MMNVKLLRFDILKNRFNACLTDNNLSRYLYLWRMELHFSKYQGTGNDFIMVDNRGGAFPKNDTTLIARLCDRRFGIGADGLILLENDEMSDFRMVYFNADGNQSTMCGNGGRSIVAFAKQLGMIGNQTTFTAIDGPHHASIDGNGIVSLQMKDVEKIFEGDGYFFADTGSPHHIVLVDDVKKTDVYKDGSAIRHGSLYGQAGSNVNFVTPKGDDLFAVRTYERGVEDETLSCGTGVTAVALAMHRSGRAQRNQVDLEVEGGQLKVAFEPDGQGYKNVFLIGPAQLVFNGTITV